MRGRFDPLKKRFDIDQGDIGNMDLGVALSGNIDFSGDDPRIAAGIAGTRMSVAALKRLWPVVVAPKVRTWVNDHLVSGTVERMVIAVNAPFNTLKESGPPVPDDGLSLEAVTTGTVIRPVEGLPAIRDADLNVHIVGRNATVMLGKGTADLPSGRKLTMTNGLFEVPDTAPHEPPARVRFKLDGPVAAAAELLATDRLRDASGAPFDPASTQRNDDGASRASDADEARSAAGLDELRDHRRCHQFCRRSHGDGAEGRGRDAARDGQ